MSATHTPGPWRMGVEGNLRVYGPDGQNEHSGLIANVFKCRANAALIAAAPELLKACVDVLAQFEAGYFVRNTDSDGCSDWAIKAFEPLRALAKMQAAVAKAEGHDEAHTATTSTKCTTEADQ